MPQEHPSPADHPHITVRTPSHWTTRRFASTTTINKLGALLSKRDFNVEQNSDGTIVRIHFVHTCPEGTIGQVTQRLLEDGYALLGESNENENPSSEGQRERNEANGTAPCGRGR